MSARGAAEACARQPSSQAQHRRGAALTTAAKAAPCVGGAAANMESPSDAAAAADAESAHSVKTIMFKGRRVPIMLQVRERRAVGGGMICSRSCGLQPTPRSPNPYFCRTPMGPARCWPLPMCCCSATSCSCRQGWARCRRCGVWWRAVSTGGSPTLHSPLLPCTLCRTAVCRACLAT